MTDLSPLDPTYGLPLRPGESVYGCLRRLEREAMDAVPDDPRDEVPAIFRIALPEWITDKQEPVGTLVDLLVYLDVHFGANPELYPDLDTNGRSCLRLSSGDIFATEIDRPAD